MLNKWIHSQKGREHYRQSLLQGAQRHREAAATFIKNIAMIEAKQQEHLIRCQQALLDAEQRVLNVASNQQAWAAKAIAKAESLERTAEDFKTPAPPADLLYHADYLYRCASDKIAPSASHGFYNGFDKIKGKHLGQLINDCMERGWIRFIPGQFQAVELTDNPGLKQFVETGNLPESLLK